MWRCAEWLAPWLAIVPHCVGQGGIRVEGTKRRRDEGKETRLKGIKAGTVRQ